MRNESQYLMEHFPVRKSRKQKSAFLDWATDTLQKAGYTPKVEEAKSTKSRNLIIGDPDTASVIFTAHYDTPARLPYPNFIVPQSMLLTLVAQAPLLILMFAVIFGIEGLILHFVDSPLAGLLSTYVMLFGVFYLMLAGPANPRNVNDNTSGVVTILETALSLPPELRSSTAFILFDHEELGLLGSSAFYKSHKKKVSNTLLINFDCVSEGDHVRFFPGKGLKKRPELLQTLEAAFSPIESKTVAVANHGYYPSDQKHFPLGVGVAVLRKGFLGLCLGRIHTGRDVIFQPENIELLRTGCLSLAGALAPKDTVSDSSSHTETKQEL